MIVAFEEKRVFASKQRERYFQPKWSSGEELVVKINPFKPERVATFRIPSDPAARFNRLRWHEFRTCRVQFRDAELSDDELDAEA